MSCLQKQSILNLPIENLCVSWVSTVQYTMTLNRCPNEVDGFLPFCFSNSKPSIRLITKYYFVEKLEKLFLPIFETCALCAKRPSGAAVNYYYYFSLQSPAQLSRNYCMIDWLMDVWIDEMQQNMSWRRIATDGNLTEAEKYCKMTSSYR